jgi:hypothetical protein
MPPLFTLLHVSSSLFKYNPYNYFCFLCLVFSFVWLCFNLLFLLLFLKNFAPSHCCCVLLLFLSSSLSGSVAFHYHALFVVPWLLMSKVTIPHCYALLLVLGFSLLCVAMVPLGTSLTYYCSLAPCCCMLHLFPLVVWFLQFGTTPHPCFCVSEIKRKHETQASSSIFLR